MAMPFFVLLAALLFLGMLLASYLARAGGASSYAGVQMGLVLPMILVVSPAECGNLWAAISRVLGVVIAVVCSLAVKGVVAVVWPRSDVFSPADPAGN